MCCEINSRKGFPVTMEDIPIVKLSNTRKKRTMLKLKSVICTYHKQMKTIFSITSYNLLSP